MFVGHLWFIVSDIEKILVFTYLLKNVSTITKIEITNKERISQSIYKYYQQCHFIQTKINTITQTINLFGVFTIWV